MSKETATVIPEETMEAFGGDELRARVFFEKYALRDESGNPTETTPDQMWERVAREIASVEATEELRLTWKNRFKWLLTDFKLVAGGRIMFGAGQSRKSTLLNCYYFPIREDSLEGIFDWCKEAARTFSYGGGVGTDLSNLRPRGSPVNNSAISSTGAVSFMNIMSETTGTIGQVGRRGALMISIRVDHPDVVEFINVKKDLNKVNFANISVKVTDKFMEAVEKDEDFELYFKNEKVDFRRTVKAKEVWNSLVQAAWQSAEPGLIFWDTMKRYSTTEYNGMEVSGVNPCSEQTLENYGCCCLGSINLSAFVSNPFTDIAFLDKGMLETAVAYATRFLDDVLDYNSNKHPLDAQKRASLWSRRIGVGFTGLGDMLVKLGKKYDEQETIDFVERLFDTLSNKAYQTSTRLAIEKGSAPGFDVEKHMTQPFIKNLHLETRKLIERQGLRNCAILTIPPVGSGSILTASSSGIEPIFALSYKRKSKSMSKEEFNVEHPLVKEYRKVLDIKASIDPITKSLPSYFVTAHDVNPGMRVKMQATIQKHIDTAISSTINLPKSATPEEVANIYRLAWKLGCKGITVYREGSREGILITNGNGNGNGNGTLYKEI
jgi:ribonucleoside-diphosphate reductase alpha chain